MKSIYLFTTLLCLLAQVTFAQNALLKGSVQTADGNNAAYATVALLDRNGQTLYNTFSDSSGLYTFSAEKGKHYIIHASAVGYQPAVSDTVTITGDTVVAAAITLLLDVHNLQGITISSAKKLFEMQADKLVMNIENNPVATGNSVFQMIRQAPGISTDKDDNLRLKGAAALIYINGRTAFLTGTQLTDYLKNLPADMVATIEIITQPSGKYDAAGTAGIININLKKNKAYGLNGVLSMGGGYGRYPKVNGGLNLNYRKGKINVYGNVNPGYSESFNKLTYNSIISDSIYQDRNNYWHPKSTWLPFTLGADYYLNEKSVLGILVNGEHYTANALTDNTTTFSNAARNPYQYIISQRRDNSLYNNTSYNVNYKITLDSMGSDLTLNADYGRFSSKGLDVNDNVYLNAALQPFRPDYTFRQSQPSTVVLTAATADYTQHLRLIGKINIGGKYSHVSTDNNLQVDSLGEGWMHDYNRSNHFTYKEQIIAGYINWSQQWKKTSLQLGLRGEQTNGTGQSVTLGQENQINYFSLFPTAYLSQVLDSNNTLSANYGRRINRPSYGALNPFSFYMDPYTSFAGNPYLKPSFAHSLELKHSYKQKLFTTLSYRYAQGETVSTILQDATTGRVVNMGQNGGNSRYLRLDVFTILQPTRWWSVETSIGLGAGRSTSEIPGFSYDTRAFTADLYTNHSFNIGHDVKLQTSFSYTAPTRDGLAKLQSGYGLHLSAQKQLWNNRATIRININNLIGMTAYRAHYLGEGLNIRWRNEWEGRQCHISFSYKFGSQQIKAARERSNNSEERNRIGR